LRWPLEQGDPAGPGGIGLGRGERRAESLGPIREDENNLVASGKRKRCPGEGRDGSVGRCRHHRQLADHDPIALHDDRVTGGEAIGGSPVEIGLRTRHASDLGG
jgi:hypothetical protein